MVRSKEFDPERALDKAMRLFWHSGYENTSLEALIREMGIARNSGVPRQIKRMNAKTLRPVQYSGNRCTLRTVTFAIVRLCCVAKPRKRAEH